VKDLQGSITKRVKGVEDLNIRITRAQGIVGVGATTRTSTASYRAAGYRPSTAGSPAAPASSCRCACSPAYTAALFFERLRAAFDAGMLSFFGELTALAAPAAFPAYLRPLRRVKWVVYAKRPFGGAQQVLDYLGCYTHRVAIANSRLIDLTVGQVRFRWKDYRHPQRPTVMTLPAGEFIRRFLLHVLPDGFRRIHFGFLANAHRRAKLALIRSLLDLPASERPPQPADYRERYARLFGQSLDICPACGGHLVEIAVLKRAPMPAEPFSCDSS
jgi:hypothetical protein